MLSNDNEMVEVKVLMALSEENDAISKEGAKNGEWVKISMRKVHTLLEMEDNDDRKTYIDYLCIDLNYVKEQRKNLLSKHRDLVHELNACKEQLFILLIHDTGSLLLTELQRNTTDPLVAVTDSLATDYDSADESSVCNTLLPPLNKFDGVIINEPSSAPAKGNKSSLASKVNSTPAGKLKSVKIKDDTPLAIKERSIQEILNMASKDVKLVVAQLILQQITMIFNGSKEFDEKRETIFNSNKEIVMIALRVRDVYVLDMTSSAQESCFFTKASENLNWLWHKRLAHLNFKTINKLAKQNLVIGLPSLVYSKEKPCFSCEKGKHHKASFKTKHTYFIKKRLHLLHIDLFRPVTPRFINHEKYTPVIVDEYSRYTWVYLLKKKRIILVNFYDEKGISQNFSSPYTPEQNGVAERKNRTLIEAARTILSASVFSKQY
ncbi:retrovirus-related pol polyprotein from transposon TNT 1-94 [Tanacetum coccineum]